MPQRIFGLLLTAMGALWAWDGWRLGRETRSYSMFDDLGPDRYLMLLGGLLMVLGIALVLRAAKPETAEANDERPSVWQRDSPVTFTLVLIAYGLLITWLGYALSTLLFFLVAFHLAGRRHWGRTVAMSAAAALAFYILFVRLADMPLPRGLIGA